MPEPGRRRRLLILAICCLSLFIFGVDNTIVNVALPSIQRDLHAPVSGLQWTVDAYTVACRSCWIEGSATFTIVLSTPKMNRLMQQMARISSRRRRLGSGTGSLGAHPALVLVIYN